MDQVYLLAEKLLNDINDYAGRYTTEDGKDITSEDSVRDLEYILQAGATLHKYIVEKELYKGKPAITAGVMGVQRYLEQLAITPENADKLRLSNAMQLWNQFKIAVAVLASNILDYRDENEESGA